MPQIQALLAPPSLEEIDKEKRKRDGLAQHPYYKRPGRGHNRDCCDACKEGGGLICCDSCPASFHLQCHDPPLEECDLPKGLWHCHSCRVRKTQGDPSTLSREMEADGVDSDSSRSGKQSRTEKSNTQEQPSRILKRRRTNNSEDTDGEPTAKLEKLEKLEKLQEVEESEENKSAAGSLFGSLIKVAAAMNPKQFELPSELVEPITFPGTSKACLKKPGNGSKKKLHELDNGLVPFPIKTCFYCNKSCRKAPMVACDFCPLVFHLDCLDPPLVCMPVGKWMCPTHPQNIESQLLTDSRLTERVKLWSFMQHPIDQEAVKINFLRKVHRKDPPFRRKVMLPGLPRIKVPQIIKDQYKYPPLLPPRLVGSQPFYWASIFPTTRHAVASEGDNNKSDKDVAIEIDENELENNFEHNLKSHEAETEVAELLDTTGDTLSCDDMSEEKSLPQEYFTEKKLPNESVEDTDLRRLENEVKNYLATLKHSMKERNLKVFMEKLSDDLLSSLDSNMLRLLAMQRIQELILNPESRTLTIFPYPGLFTPNSSTHTNVNQPWFQANNTSENASSQPTVFPRQPRAFLCPLSSAYPPAPLYNRQLTIGTGANMDLTLTSFGSCNYVSGHHSTIFYDEMSKHFELLNYSEHGTIVDNVVYCCDVTGKASDHDSKEKEKKSIFHGMDNLLRRNNSDKTTNTSGITSHFERKEGIRCGCRTSISSIGSTGDHGKSGWEGTGLLTHGSHIKFGCLQFILCISNANEKPRFIHH